MIIKNKFVMYAPTASAAVPDTQIAWCCLSKGYATYSVSNET